MITFIGLGVAAYYGLGFAALAFMGLDWMYRQFQEWLLVQETERFLQTFRAEESSDVE